MFGVFKIGKDIERVENKLKVMKVIEKVYAEEVKKCETGKYFTKNEILEKLGFLNPDEFLIAKNYLEKIKGE